MLSRGPSGDCSMSTDALIPSAVVKRFRNSRIGCVASGIFSAFSSQLSAFSFQFSRTRCVGLAAADTLHLSLGGRPGRRANGRWPDQVVRQVLLADAPEVADQPVERNAGRRPEKHERE